MGIMIFKIAERGLVVAQRNIAVDNLRGLACLLVAIYHFNYMTTLNIRWVNLWGFLGVKVFFVVSGYLIFASFQSNKDKYGTRDGIKLYALNRLCRIVPAYYLSLMFVFLMVPFVIPNGWVFSSTFMSQAISHLTFTSYLVFRTAGFGLNGSYWTLSIEMLWYILAPILVLYCNSVRAITTIMVLSLLYLLGLDLHVLDFLVRWTQPPQIFHVPYETQIQYLSYQLPGQIIYFGTGILLYKLNHTKYGEVLLKTARHPANRILSLVGIVTVMGLLRYVYNGWAPITVTNFEFVVISFIIYILMHKAGGRYNLLTWYGKISYSVYLWNYPLAVIGVDAGVTKHLSNLEWFITFISVLTAVSAFSYYFVEERGFIFRDTIRERIFFHKNEEKTNGISA